MFELHFRKRIRFLLSVAVLAGVSLAAQTITLSTTSGPPGTRVGVHGSGFPANTAILLRFAKMFEMPATSDASGDFKNRFWVPKAAQPGRYRVEAGTRALFPMTVVHFEVLPAEWPQFGFIPAGAALILTRISSAS